MSHDADHDADHNTLDHTLDHDADHNTLASPVMKCVKSSGTFCFSRNVDLSFCDADNGVHYGLESG